jgi:sugar lactone lactonase YvrE
MTCELILDAQNAVGESPVWVPEHHALYWVDIPLGKLWRWNHADGTTATWQLPEKVGCVAHIDGSQWIGAFERMVAKFSLLAPGHVAAAPLALVPSISEGMRFNDGRCDRQGRLLAGTMFMDMSAAKRVGKIYQFSGGGNARELLDDFITLNGMAFSPDGRTMYLSDSHPDVQTVWAFDYDTETGTPSNRRVFVDMHDYPGRPDGAAVDADGCYWICGNDAGLVHRFTPDGKLDRSLAVPVKKPAMCAFGGVNLDVLFVTSIRPSGVDLSDQPLAGGVFALHPGVHGLPEPKFKS